MQVTTVEEEKSRLSGLLQVSGELEAQLELANANAKKKQALVFSLENQHMALMKSAALTQEMLTDKEHLLEEVMVMIMMIMMIMIIMIRIVMMIMIIKWSWC